MQQEGQLFTEGLVTVQAPPRKPNEKAEAFINPAQVVNRDLSLTVIQWYVDARRAAAPAEPITYLEALAASGLRSIRVARETRGLTRIVANDLEPAAVEQMRANVVRNGLEVGRDLEVSCADAVDLLYQHRAPERRFDIIDLDPYGAPALFLDGAVQAVKDGGLLQVTCTDLLTLCGNQPETCFRKYGSVPLKSRMCHEIAIRIALNAIASRAQTYGRYIEPVASFMIDFYVRVFVRVHTGGKVMQNGTKMGHLWQCPNCHSFVTEPFLQQRGPTKYSSTAPPANRDCAHCNGRHKVGGPLWLGPLHDPQVLEALLANVHAKGEAALPSYRKLQGLLTVAATELVDVPLFLNLSDLCNVLHVAQPSSHVFRSALINAGYRVSSVHVNPQGFKTDAPLNVVWDILRCWYRRKAEGKVPKPQSPAAQLLSVAPQLEADFSLVDTAKPVKGTAPRFVKVPGWGPKTKGKQGTKEATAAPEAPSKRPKTDAGDDDVIE